MHECRYSDERTDGNVFFDMYVIYIFTKAEETYVQNVMQFTCIAKKNLKHAENVQCSLHASNVFIQMRLHLFLSNAIKARPHLRMLILQ